MNDGPVSAEVNRDAMAGPGHRLVWKKLSPEAVQLIAALASPGVPIEDVYAPPHVWREVQEAFPLPPPAPRAA